MDGENATPEGRKPRKKGRKRRLAGWSSLVLFVAGVLAFCWFVLFAMGETLTAPDWLRSRIEDRIERSLSGAQLSFGEIDLIVHKGWRPRLGLRDLELRDAEGRRILELADAEATLSMRALLRGQVQPKRIQMRGAFATLARDKDGNVALRLGDAQTELGAPGLPQLIGGLDDVLQGPLMSALLSAELQELTLTYEDARAGRVWTADGGVIALERARDQLRLSGSVALLSGRDFASFLEVNYSSTLGEITSEYGFTFTDMSAQDIAVQNVALNWLDVLRAPISGAVRGRIEEDGALGPLSATLQIGEGALRPTDQTRPIPFRQARSYFTYDPQAQVITFDELSVQSNWVSGVAEGSAWLGGIENGTLNELIGQITVTNVSANPDNLYESAIELPRSTADFRLELAPFRLTIGEMTAREGQSLFRSKGQLIAAEAGWDLAVDGMLDQITPERLVALWPQNAAPKPRKWVAENISGGTLLDTHFALRLSPGQAPSIYVDFDYDDVALRFLKTMPPISGGVGQASLVGDRLVTTLSAGQVDTGGDGVLDLTGSSFIIPDLGIKKAAPGILRLQAAGPVRAVLSLLNRKPLEVLRDTPFGVDLAQGQARASGTLSLPLKDRIQPEEILYHYRGEITGFTSTQLIPDRRMQGDRLVLEGDQGRVSIAGALDVEGLPVTGRWEQELGRRGAPGFVTGTGELSPRAIEVFDIGLPEGSVSGRGTGEFSLALQRGKPPRLSLRSDLRGVGLSVEALGWRKPRAARGALQVEVDLGDAPRVDQVTLNAAGLRAEGTVTTKPDGGLDVAALSLVELDGWLRARARLVGQGQNAVPDLVVQGGTLDLRRASFGGSGGGTGGGGNRINAALDRLQITEGLALTDFSGQFTTGGGLRGSFHGRLNGGTRVSGALEPSETAPGGRSVVRISAEDAGGVIRDAGLLTQGRGGVFSMHLEPVGVADYDGWLRVTGTRIKDAPAIAAIVNAVSVIGLFDELSGRGIHFSEVDARFRISKDKVTLYEGSATGPSIGLTMDGVYDSNRKWMDMQGVISPLYLLNGVGSLLTRKGEGLIGFTYKLTGPSSKPSVSVNPLSALAPAMLREVFRKPAPKAPGGKEAGPLADPPPQPGTLPHGNPRRPGDGAAFEGR